MFPPELRQEFENELISNGLGTFLVYPGTNHGFVVRPNGSEQTNQQRDKAIQDAITYFKNNIELFSYKSIRYFFITFKITEELNVLYVVFPNTNGRIDRLENQSNKKVFLNDINKD
jgi:hypothetical protein